MDDHNFDDRINKKLKEFIDPNFDEDAYHALETRLSSTFQPVRWFSKHRTELIIIPAMIACTALILLQRMYSDSSYTSLHKIIDEQKLLIEDLEHQVARLKEVKADTIVTLEVRSDENLNKRIFLLEQMLAQNRYFPVQESSSQEADNAGAFVNLHEPVVDRRLVPHESKRESDHAVMQFQQPSSSEKKLSVATIRELERHYCKGVGIQIGPTLELSQSVYAHAEGKVNGAGGISANFILSPSLSMLTGLEYSKRFYETSSPERLPSVDESLGTLELAEVDTWALRMPVHVRYSLPTSLTKRWIFSAGFSNYYIWRQLFEYEYALQGNLKVASSFDETRGKFYPGTIDFALGLNRRLKNLKSLETSLIYQHSFNGLGVEKQEPFFLGVKATYWFDLKK